MGGQLFAPQTKAKCMRGSWCSKATLYLASDTLNGRNIIPAKKIVPCDWFRQERLKIWVYKIWFILLKLVYTGNHRFLAIFYNLAANEYEFLPKSSKISINTPK